MPDGSPFQSGERTPICGHVTEGPIGFMPRSTTSLISLVFAVAPTLAAGSSCRDCEDSPAIEIESTYTGEVWQTSSGDEQRYLDNLDLTVAVDGARAFGVDGMQLFGYALYNNGHVMSDELIGAAQGISNIEAIHAVR